MPDSSKKPRRPRGRAHARKMSEVLQELSQNLTKPKMTFGELQQIFSGRFYGLLMFVLALPNLVPIPAPGLSALMGIPLILLTFQQAIGLETPWFPKFITNSSIKTALLKRVCERALPCLKKAETLIKPRLTIFVRPPAEQLIAAICLILSFAITMPIPFGNALPALAICLFSIALLQRDGLFVILALVVGLSALSVIIAALDAGISAMQTWIEL